MARSETTGTKIANRILEIYKDKKINMDFKNVQRRVYDALNVLTALNIIIKDRNRVKFKGSPFINGQGIDKLIAGSLNKRNKKSQEKRERDKQLIEKRERLEKLEEQIADKQKAVDQQSQLLKEKVLQHLAIKKLIPRNFSCAKLSGNEPSEKIPIPFVGLVMQHQDQGQKILLQITNQKDLLSLYSESPITAFTENDVFQSIGVAQTDEKEVRDLIKPAHLKYVSQVFNT